MTVDLADPIPYSLAEGNYLTPNGLGGYLISASAIGSWSYCQLRRYYELRARHVPEAPRGTQLSATAFGSVMHAAIMHMELAIHEERDNPLGVALKFFEHYWSPANITAICPPIDEWLPRETWEGLLNRGRYVLRTYYHDMAVRKDSYLMALEHSFAVPLEVRGRTHTIIGAVDRLEIRRHYRKPYIGVDDLKTGRRPFYLRYNTQGSMYAYASSKREFWEGWPESGATDPGTPFPRDVMAELQSRFASYGFAVHDGQKDLKTASRRFRWVDLKDMKMVDGGWRGPRDYARLVLAIDAYVRASEAEIYSVNAEGEKCRYCPFRGICGGTGLPAESEGAP